MGFPDISIHNSIAWNDSFRDDDHVIGLMFAGKDKKGREDAVFIAFNTYWETCGVELPKLPEGYRWEIDFYTAAEKNDTAALSREGNKLWLSPRSAVVAAIYLPHHAAL